VLFHLSNMEKI